MLFVRYNFFYNYINNRFKSELFDYNLSVSIKCRFYLSNNNVKDICNLMDVINVNSSENFFLKSNNIKNKRKRFKFFPKENFRNILNSNFSYQNKSLYGIFERIFFWTENRMRDINDDFIIYDELYEFISYYLFNDKYDFRNLFFFSGNSKFNLEDNKKFINNLFLNLNLINNNNIFSSCEEEGVVVAFKDSIVTILGLSRAKLNELVFFNSGLSGLILNLENNVVRALVFDNSNIIVVGEKVFRSGYVMRLPVTDSYLGRIINPLGQFLDGLDSKSTNDFMNIERKASGVITRDKISQPVITGTKVIDALVPIGRGQRELILGDRKTGKTMLVIDSILNQVKTFSSYELPVICIYVAIGKRKTEVNRLWNLIKSNNSNFYTIFVISTASDAASLQFIAPYSGCTLAEFFTFNGKHTLVIYDDLSKHADVYRQISLLLRRPVGREAYPGDVFYLHSRLLERAAKLNRFFGNGSMTALPIVETIQGDVSAYIPTNIISITDGQVYLDWDRHQQGIRPAIDPGISVSRVGTSAQVIYMKKLSGSLKLELAQFREVEQFSKLGSELDAQTLKMLKKGQLLTEILKQKHNKPLALSTQIINLFLINQNFPKINDEINLINYYVRFLPLFVKCSSIFVPYKYILDLIDKDKILININKIDLMFIYNVFWKICIFGDEKKYGNFFFKFFSRYKNKKNKLYVRSISMDYLLNLLNNKMLDNYNFNIKIIIDNILNNIKNI